MAGTGATNRDALEAEFLNKVDTNNVNGITAVDVRDTLNSLKDSNLNITDDDAKILTAQIKIDGDKPIVLKEWELGEKAQIPGISQGDAFSKTPPGSDPHASKLEDLPVPSFLLFLLPPLFLL